MEIEELSYSFTFNLYEIPLISKVCGKKLSSGESFSQ